MPKSFILQDFEVPLNLESDHFYFRLLDESVAQADYEAVMSSQQRLHGIFGNGSDWPEEDMTLEDNIASLKVHKQEFNAREAFAYSVFNQSKSKCLGSVYIDPSESIDYQCQVHLWIRDDSIELDNELYQTVRQWLEEAWSFSKVDFPGRSA